LLFAHQISALTAHFDQEFVNQVWFTSTCMCLENPNYRQYHHTQDIDPLILEDTLSGFNSPAKSRRNSRGEPVSDGGVADYGDEYAGFEYSDSNFQCTDAQYREFEVLLESKILKANRKKQLKAKKEGQKTATEEVCDITLM
jgi:hypothetical protein